MKVHLYTRCWNDADMLEFMFRHYDPFVQKYFIYDDGSTDGSRDILSRHQNVVLRSLPAGDPKSRILSTVNFFNDVWHESRSKTDWVIITDIDEHLYHPDLKRYLQSCQSHGVTLIPALGYQMISDVFPEPSNLLLSAHLTRGAPWPQMSKLGFFAPDRIESINYSPGRHSCAPTGDIKLPHQDELLLLHYKYLGFDRTHKKHEIAATRSREIDIANNWGHKYFWTKEKLADDWKSVYAESIEVLDPNINHHSVHKGKRWWASLPRASDG